MKSYLLLILQFTCNSLYHCYSVEPLVVVIDLRLAGGSTSTEGFVEVYYSGEWFSVCNTSSSSFGTEEASTVCRQLGYKLLNLTSRYYRTSITTAYIFCSDSWSNLNRCSITTTSCSSLYHPYVQCTSES